MKPKEVLELTYKEFVMIVEENEEKMHDINEREAMYAIIYAAASRGKGKNGKLPKVEDLYDRDSASKKDQKKDSFEDIVERQEKTLEWLSKFDLSGLQAKEGEEKTEKNPKK